MADNAEKTTSTEAPKSKTGLSLETSVVTGEAATKFEGGAAETTESNSNELDLGDETLDAGPEPDAEGDAPEAETEAEPEAEAEAEDALPDYDPENEEVHAAYAARYEKDGGLNMEALSKDYWASFNKAEGDVAAKVAKAGLPEGVYKYLQATAGVSKDYVKKIEKALVADHTQDQVAAVAAVAPVEEFNKAIEWGRAGGYTPEQIKRFNAAFERGGDDRADAIEALMGRFERATKKDPQAKNFGQRRFGDNGGRRPSSPKRDVTGQAASGGAGSPGDVFKNRAEHQSAWSSALNNLTAARKTGDKQEIRKAQQAVDAVAKKARRSKFK